MLRIGICQPNVRHYRIPVFNLLAQQPDIDLTVFAGTAEGASLPPTEELRFKFVHAELDRRSIGPIDWWWQQAQLDVIDRGRFDLVILTWNVHYRSLGPALHRARQCQMPLALWGHGYSKRSARPRLRSWLRNRAGRRADAVLVYSHTAAQRLIQQYSFDRDRVFVAPNCMDQQPVQAARQHWLERPDALKEFQVTEELDPYQTIVFVSRLLAQNRCEMLINALYQLCQDRSGTKLVVIGDGPAQESMQQRTAELGLADQVKFTGAIYNEMELAPWMMSATLFSYPVNIGLSLQHAFGYGLPVVTSDNIGAHNPEIEALEHGANGLLYRDGSVEDMVSKWQAIMNDPALRQRMSEAAHDQVTKRYTLEAMIQGFLDLMTIVDGQKRVTRGK